MRYHVITFLPLIGWIFVALVAFSRLSAELLARKNF